MTGNPNDIYAAMIRIEQAALTSVDANFKALRFLPVRLTATSPRTDPYPCSFRLPLKGRPVPYSDVSGGRGVNVVDQFKPRQKWVFSSAIGVAVGQTANLTDQLDTLANDMIQPLLSAYYAHYNLCDTQGDPTIEFFEFGEFETIPYKPFDTSHWAVMFPIYLTVELPRVIAANG